MPYFYVDDISISKVDNKTVITGYDVIGSNRKKVISEISFTYPTTAKAYATKIATSIGATVDYLGYNFSIAESPNFDGSESI